MKAGDMAGGWEMRTPTDSEVQSWINVALLFAVKENFSEITIGPDVAPAYADVRFIRPNGERRPGPGLGRGQLEPTIKRLMAMADLDTKIRTSQTGQFSVQASGKLHDFQISVEAANDTDLRARLRRISAAT